MDGNADTSFSAIFIYVNRLDSLSKYINRVFYNVPGLKKLTILV